jgi:hypothetical protein
VGAKIGYQKNKALAEKCYKGGIIFLMTFGLSRTPLIASASAATPEQFDYPELTVTPRASDRLQMEAQKEPDHKWTTFLPIQTSAAATLVAGVLANDPNNFTGFITGVSVGGAWLVTSTLLALTYTPYSSAYSEVSPLPKGTVREQLTRERMAEESINRIARVGERIKWISFSTNLAASVFMLLQGKNNLANATPTYSPAGLMTGSEVVSAVFAFAPLFMRFYWSDVRDQQENYKKRIYGPVATSTVFYDSGTRTYVPGFSLSLRF